MSDVVGLGPVILHKADLSKSAKSVFEHTAEPVDPQQVLMRIFLTKPRVMVWRVTLPMGSPIEKLEEYLSVRDYLSQLNIDYIVTDDGGISIAERSK
jgi:hypothetical protein